MIFCAKWQNFGSGLSGLGMHAQSRFMKEVAKDIIAPRQPAVGSRRTAQFNRYRTKGKSGETVVDTLRKTGIEGGVFCILVTVQNDMVNIESFDQVRDADPQNSS